MHAYVTAPDADSVNKAVRRIRSTWFPSSLVPTKKTYREVIQQGVEVPEGSNELRKMQLRELALLNGTLREDGMAKCTNCGATDHKAWQCQDKANVTNNVMCGACGGVGHTTGDCKARRTGDWQQQGGSSHSAGGHKMDQEYMSLMAELGEGPPPQQVSSSLSNICLSIPYIFRCLPMVLFEITAQCRPMLNSQHQRPPWQSKVDKWAPLQHQLALQAPLPMDGLETMGAQRVL